MLHELVCLTLCFRRVFRSFLRNATGRKRKSALRAFGFAALEKRPLIGVPLEFLQKRRALRRLECGVMRMEEHPVASVRRREHFAVVPRPVYIFAFDG